jgi:hypothetical protein
VQEARVPAGYLSELQAAGPGSSTELNEHEDVPLVDLAVLLCGDREVLVGADEFARDLRHSG